MVWSLSKEAVAKQKFQGQESVRFWGGSFPLWGAAAAPTLFPFAVSKGVGLLSELSWWVVGWKKGSKQMPDTGHPLAVH